MSDLIFSKEEENNKIIANKDENIKNDAFCYTCNKNIPEMCHNCKSHDIKYFKDLTKEIDIELIKENLRLAINNYEKVYKVMEEKLNSFKKRNENQIALAKLIIEVYKKNINNLNYQIILNTKNLLHFNQIQLKNYEGFYSQFIFSTNILKEFPLNNYINEKLDIKKIQKNTEIKCDSKLNVENALILDKSNKLIFNTENNIYLLNMDNYLLEDKTQTEDYILLMNLMNKEEMILISFPNSIKKLEIENNKIIIQDFLNNVDISEPGMVIKYHDEYAWTNSEYIEFNARKSYNYKEDFERDNFDYEITYDFQVINLIQFYDDILFIIFLKTLSNDQNFEESIFKLGSYKKRLLWDYYIHLEDFIFSYDSENQDYDYYQTIKCQYNMFISSYYEVIIMGKLGLYIINPYKWEMIKEISFSGKLIENTFYLNNSCFFIFCRKYPYEKIFFRDEAKESEVIKNNNENNNILIVKCTGKNFQIIFESLYNFEGRKFFCNPYINDSIFNLINKFITVQTNSICVYDLINIDKKIGMKHN